MMPWSVTTGVGSGTIPSRCLSIFRGVIGVLSDQVGVIVTQVHIRTCDEFEVRPEGVLGQYLPENPRQVCCPAFFGGELRVTTRQRPGRETGKSGERERSRWKCR